MYRCFFKRFFDLILTIMATIVLFPLFLVLTVFGAVFMKGNPFFCQPRPGYKEKIFRLIKFRTMTNEKDKNGRLLPDSVRLNKYGRFLRKTSLDELPEFFNIIKGDMAIVGPRPLRVMYLDRYTEEQHHRHDVRSGLTGWAQVNGRNTITWEERFEKDIWYVNHISFALDLKIIFMTIKNVLNREGISSDTTATMEEFMGTKANENKSEV